MITHLGVEIPAGSDEWGLRKKNVGTANALTDGLKATLDWMVRRIGKVPGPDLLAKADKRHEEIRAKYRAEGLTSAQTTEVAQIALLSVFKVRVFGSQNGIYPVLSKYLESPTERLQDVIADDKKAAKKKAATT